ncbi:AraC family transcriptional regulator [uncultured Marinobacter sp.]|uniref:AraC family transcriptional regulator n=1 Tax=uncultured Marinobacter sp. TaxID=187379 RepID=UPI0030DD3E20|tara:strand:+ start:50673 stop:51221 length:549 start_codon:yes stop_codon:yes gene_type:complete
MFGIQQAQKRRIHEHRTLTGWLFLLLLLPAPTMAAASLDEEIEELSVEVSGHSASVFALEQKLLHPANTRLAVFLTLQSRNPLDLDSVELFVNGQPVASHLYTERERASLERGGVQQLFTGNLRNGDHELKTVITARSANDDFVRRESIHRFRKRPGTLRLQMSLEARAPDYEPRVSFVEWK